MDGDPYLLDKPLGATPLASLDAFRAQYGVRADARLAYAGRLDPMATGLLVVLHGDLLQRQEEFWYLPKEYDATVLLGCVSDSYDLLGIPEATGKSAATHEAILTALQGLVGKPHLPVPVFSSVREKGKPLFAWARGGELPTDVPVPVRQMVIQQIDANGITTTSRGEFLAVTCERVSAVRGDFRQEAVCTAWRTVADRLPAELVLVRFHVACGSGTYIRSLAHELGRRLKTGAVLAELRRTRVGPWHITDDAVRQIRWPA